MPDDEGDGPELTLRVLGPLEVEVGGQPIDVPSRLERAVLVALAVRVGRAVSVDFLAGALWGEELPSSWRKSIQVRLSNLRQRLDQAGVVDVRRVLATAADGYSLRVDEHQVDATRFEALFDQGRQALLAGDAATAEAVLSEALRLWRDDPVPELADTATGQAEAARLVELRHTAQEERVDAGLALGRHAEVVGWVEAALVEQPLRERRWAQLMLALHRSGRQAEALRAYQRARELLVDELGIEPGPTLTRLEQSIVAHDPDLDLALRPTTGPPTPKASLRDSTQTLTWARRQAEHPLIGRAAEWEQLWAAHRAAVRAHDSAAVLVTGGVGMGKSRLAAELCLEAAAAGAVVIRGQALPGVPLSLLRSVVQAVDPTASADEATDAPAVVDQLGDRLEAAASEAPLLVVVEDLQWADTQTIAIVRRLLDRFRPGAAQLPTTIVGQLRLGTDLPHGAAEILAEVDRFPVHGWIDLGPMSDEDLGELLSVAVDRVPAVDVVELVVRAAGGNPGVVIELAGQLRTRGALDDAGRWTLDGPPTLATLGLPVTLQSSVEERARELSVEARALVSAMALYGQAFEVGEVMVIAAVDEESAFVLLAEAVDAGLVREMGGGRFAFVTEVDGAVLAQKVSTARRSRIEARIAGSRIPWGNARRP